MASPFQTDDSTSSERAIGRRPIVLARLPRVGEGSSNPASGSAPVVAAINPGKSTPADEKASPSYFVDRQHTALPSMGERPAMLLSREEQLASVPEKQKPPRRHSTRQRSTARNEQLRPQPTGLAAGFCQVHSFVAPHAGAIVALALLTSAGLLYWLTLSPLPAATNGYDNFAIDSFETGPTVAPKFVPNTAPQEPSETIDVEAGVLDFQPAQPQPPTTPSQQVDASAQNAATEMAMKTDPVETATEQEVQASPTTKVESTPLTLPTTNYPPLDFTKLGVPGSGNPQPVFSTSPIGTETHQTTIPTSSNAN